MAILRVAVALFGFGAAHIESMPPRLCRIQQKGGNDGSSVMRYLTPTDDSAHWYRVVTGPLQSSSSQWWYLEPVGWKIYTIRQVGTGGATVSGRYLDAYEDPGNDYMVVMRDNQHNPSQQWEIVGTDHEENTFRIRQVGHNDGTLWATTRYLDAYEGGSAPAFAWEIDWQANTREPEGNPSQEWVLTPLLPEEELAAQQLIASVVHPRSVRIVAPLSLCIVAGIAMLAVVIGLMRRRNPSLSADGFAPLVDHEAGTA